MNSSNWKSTLLALGLAFMALPAFVRGQSPAPITGIQFRIFSAERIEGLNYSSNGKDVPLTILPNMISGTYAYSGAPSLSLYRIKTNADGKPVHEEAALVDLKTVGMQPLLLVAPDSTHTQGIQVVAVRDDLEAFPQGAFRFIDNTADAVSGTLDKLSFDIDPGAIKLVTISSPAPSSLYATFYSTQNGQAVQLYGNRWPYSPQMRTMVLFYKAQNGVCPLLIIDPLLIEPKFSTSNP